MKSIVIVGGGIAGKVLAAALTKKANNTQVILVEPKEYFEVPFAQLRAMTQPETFGPGIRKLFSEVLPNVQHVQDRLSSVESDKIVLESGKSIDFDYLVLSTGSSLRKWDVLKGNQVDMDSRQETILAEFKRFEAASSIAIIGGGPVGVELAGELADTWPDKKISIFEAANRLLAHNSEKLSQRAQRELEKLGVEIHTSQRLEQDDDGTWLDKNSESLNYDLFIPAVGISVNSQWAKSSDVVDVNSQGAVFVDEYLRVKGRKNIFAVGDITDVPEIKLGAFARMHADLTAKNILTLVEGGDERKLRAYKPAPPMAFVTTGRKKGVVQLPFGHPHFLIAMKQKDLMVSMFMK